MPTSIAIPYRVPYADTDTGGVVYYANYLVFFERARNELLRELGLTYKRLEQEFRLGLPVIEAHVEYRDSARYDDLLELTAVCVELKGVRFKIQCEVRREGKVLASGYTVHALVDISSEKFKPVRAPAWLVESLSR